MKGEHAQKNFTANTIISPNPGGGGARGGGWGVSHTRTGPGRHPGTTGRQKVSIHCHVSVESKGGKTDIFESTRCPAALP